MDSKSYKLWQVVVAFVLGAAVAAGSMLALSGDGAYKKGLLTAGGGIITPDYCKQLFQTVTTLSQDVRNVQKSITYVNKNLTGIVLDNMNSEFGNTRRSITYVNNSLTGIVYERLNEVNDTVNQILVLVRE